MEIWKSINGFENYQISNTEKVKSLERIYYSGAHHTTKKIQPEMLLQHKIDKNGYHYVHLYKNGKQYIKKIHRLVAEAFIPNPNNLPEVNHINLIKSDNNINNLEWCTHKYNMKHWRKLLPA